MVQTMVPSHQQPSNRRRSLVAGKRARENEQKEGREGKTHPELTLLTNPHRCLKFCKIYHMLPLLMQTYANTDPVTVRGLSLLSRLPGDRPDTTEQGEKVEADHWCWCSPSGRRTHPSTAAIASGGHPAKSWPGTAVCRMDWCTPRCVQYSPKPKSQDLAVGLVQFFVIPCSLNAWVCHIRPLKKRSFGLIKTTQLPWRFHFWLSSLFTASRLHCAVVSTDNKCLLSINYHYFCGRLHNCFYFSLFFIPEMQWVELWIWYSRVVWN